MTQFLQFAQTLAPYAITGAIVSVVVQHAKDYFDKSGHKLLLAVGVSILGGVLLQFTSFVPTAWFTTIVAVFAAANTIYLAVIKLFE